MSRSKCDRSVTISPLITHCAGIKNAVRWRVKNTYVSTIPGLINYSTRNLAISPLSIALYINLINTYIFYSSWLYDCHIDNKCTIYISQQWYIKQKQIEEIKDRDGLFSKVTILTSMPDYRPFHQTASIQTLRSIHCFALPVNLSNAYTKHWDQAA